MEGRSPDRTDLDSAIAAWIPHAMRLALRLTRSPHDAEDLVQTALLKAARAAGNFRGDASPDTWLYRILLNTFHDRPPLRLTTDLSTCDPASPTPAPDQLAEAGELSGAVDTALASLPPRQRDALLLSREGLSASDIATTLETTDANARKLVQLARDRLRELLASHLAPDRQERK